MTAERAVDPSVSSRTRRSLVGLQRAAQRPEAALAEAVLAAELPGTAAGSVVGPVADPAVQV